MAHFIEYDNNNYIRSQNIKIFPCAHRGYYNSNTTPSQALVFDPEARSTTEANFINNFHKLSSIKESYVLDWDPTLGTLKCVIGGYYVEIYNHSDLTDWFDITTQEGVQVHTPKSLCIQLGEEALSSTVTVNGNTIESERTTKVLKSFTATDKYLDIACDIDTQTYIFTGLVIKSEADLKNKAANIIAFAPMLPGYTYIKQSETFRAANKDTYLNGAYYYKESTTDNYIQITESTFDTVENLAATSEISLYKRSANVGIRVNPKMCPVTALIDTASGRYSLRMVEDLVEVESPGTNYYNTTVATGDYSTALGRHTTAIGVASTALGDTTTARGKGSLSVGIQTAANKNGALAFGLNTHANGEGSIAGGRNTAAQKEGSVAFGTYTTADGANQVVIGKYNTTDPTQAFIIGNGEATSAKLNAFTVSYEGNIKTAGNLEVNGNQEIAGTPKPAIASTGIGLNDLVLGTPAAGSCGSISIYGTNTSKVFETTKTGDTTITGRVAITDLTDYSTVEPVATGAFSVSGGARVAKNFSVGGNTTVSGNLAVEGATSLGSDDADTLTVTGFTKIQNGLRVEGDSLASTTLQTPLSVRDSVVLNDTLLVKGNSTFATDTPNDGTIATNLLTLGSNANNISGALDIYGIADTKVFSVSNNGNTNVSGNLTVTKITNLNTLEISGSTIITNNNDEAIAIAGGATVGKGLTVSGTTTLNILSVASGKEATFGGVVEVTDETDYTASNNTAALTVAGGAYIAKKLYVAGDTTFRDNLEIGETLVRIKKDTESTAVNKGALVVNGGVGIGKNLNVNGDTKTKNLTVASTDGNNGKPNIIQIGNESTSNKGGELLIYGSGTSTVFDVDKEGETHIAGNLKVDKEVTITKKLTVDSAIEISTSGISGLTGLTVGGQVNATVFNATSDARLKCNIEDYKFEKSILDLPIKRFEYINDKSHTKYIGCLAQDLQRICPELVVENSDGMLSIHESKLVYALVQEIKELKEKVELLERR